MKITTIFAATSGHGYNLDTIYRVEMETGEVHFVHGKSDLTGEQNNGIFEVIDLTGRTEEVDKNTPLGSFLEALKTGKQDENPHSVEGSLRELMRRQREERSLG